MASADFPPPDSGGISPGNGTLLRCTAAAFTSTGIPGDFAVLCQLIAPCRPSMRFLSISSQLSPSLPSPGRSPFPSWLQMVVSSFSCSGISTGDLNPIYNVPMLGTHKPAHPTAGIRCWTGPALSGVRQSRRSCGLDSGFRINLLRARGGGRWSLQGVGGDHGLCVRGAKTMREARDDGGEHPIRRSHVIPSCRRALHQRRYSRQACTARQTQAASDSGIQPGSGFSPEWIWALARLRKSCFRSSPNLLPCHS